MLSSYDYINIVLYFGLIVGVGLYFSRKSKNTSDYFRGGGALPWWITGTSAWMAAFSAWTFTGASGKMYEAGPYVLVLFYQNVISTFVLLFFTCYRFRRMRVVTPFEALRLRFGAGAQQFYTWVRLPIALILSCLGLNFVAVFMAAVFKVDLTTTLIVLGVLVTFVSMLGGSFGVAASDFVQMILVVTVTVCVAVLALAQPTIGGLSGLLDKAPAAHFNWGELARPQFITLWFLALTLNTVLGKNSLSDESAAKYMMARSDRHARLSLIIPIVGTLIGPLIWLIPPMVSAVTHPNLGAEFPQLNFPHEAAFLATASDVLPRGMLGLLVCGIFAATLTTMDASLNQGAGIFVRNFYLPIINPNCSDKKLLWLSKVATAMFGAIIITLALIVSRHRTLGFFDLLNQVGVSLLLPLAIPACLGIFYKRTPPWSAWSTVVIGLIVSLAISMPAAVRTYLSDLTGWNLPPLVTPEMFAWIPGLGGPFRPEEQTEFTVFATVAVGTVVCGGWFFFTSLFYSRCSPAYRASVDEFFGRLKIPLPEPKEETPENRAFPASVGRICLIYGALVTAFALVPNPLSGRLCFLCCGGLLFVIGALLVRRYGRKAGAAR